MSLPTPSSDMILHHKRLIQARREMYLKMMVVPFQQLWSRRDTLTLAMIQKEFPPDFASVGEIVEFEEVEHEGRQALSIRFVELHRKESTAHLLYLPGAKPKVLGETYNPPKSKCHPWIGVGGWLNALTKLAVRVQVHYDEDPGAND